MLSSLEFDMPLARREGQALRRLFHVDHPRRAEAVYEHGKPRRPECFPERHDDISLFRQGFEDFLALGDVFYVDVYVETLRLLEAFRRRVHAHQHLVSDGHVSMHDLVAPAGRHVLPLRSRRGLVTKQAINLAPRLFS